jgi:TPR repeat protein
VQGLERVSQLPASAGSCLRLKIFGLALLAVLVVTARPSIAQVTFQSRYDSLKPRAEAGDAEAQFGLGLFLSQQGWRDHQADYASAIYWYEKAALQGKRSNFTIAAAEAAARLYYHPDSIGDFGLKQDAAKARFWYSKCVEWLSGCQSNLAAMEYRGIGGPKDLVGAQRWYSIIAEHNEFNESDRADARHWLQEIDAQLQPAPRAEPKPSAVEPTNNKDAQATASTNSAAAYENAALHGDVFSAERLATKYASGNDPEIPKDDVKARFWFEKAAELGSAEAQYDFGVWEFEGRGGPVDQRDAIRWLQYLAGRPDADTVHKNAANYYLRTKTFSSPVSNPQPYPRAPFSFNYLWLFILVPVSLLVWAAIHFRKKPVKDAPYPAVFTPELKARFPDYHIYFVPASALDLFDIASPDENWIIGENFLEAWNALLARYPTPPSDELERKQREEALWERYAALWTVKNSAGQPALTPKQSLLDWFRGYEKWVFREFYAATGVVHETIVKEWVFHRAEVVKAYKMGTGVGDTDAASRARHAIEKAEDAEKRFDKETYPAHMEKWGEWFFFHIQEAFKRMAANANQNSESPTTRRDHPARDHLRYRPNA